MAICSLSKLESMTFYRNVITTIPTDINKLSSLKVLVLSHNKIKEIPPGLGSCPSLRYLDLSINKLTVLTNNFCYLSTALAIRCLICVSNTSDFASGR